MIPVTPKLLWILFLSFNGMGLFLLIFIDQVITDIRASRTWLLFLLSLLFCLFQVHYACFEMGLLAGVRWIHLFPVLGVWSMGPVMLAIIRHAVNPAHRFVRADLCHMVPALAALALGAAVLLATPFQPPQLLFGYYYNDGMMRLAGAGTLVFAGYLAAFAWIYNRFARLWGR